MKQTKIKSFIKFIGTLSNKSRQSSGITIDEAIHDKVQQSQKLHYNTIGMDEGKNKAHAIILHKTNQCIIQKCNVEFTNKQDRNIKHRYEDKKSLYEAYRNSLHKKSEQLQLANNKFISKLSSIRQSHSFQKQPLFPTRNNQIQSINTNKAHQKIFTNRSISINPYQTARRLKTPKLHSKQKAENSAKEEEYLRKKKLDYKPIFRVKKVTLLDSYRTETAPPLNQQFSQMMKIKKQRQSLANKLKIKTQPIHEYSKIISFREKRAIKNSMLNSSKVGGWDYDESEQISKIFL